MPAYNHLRPSAEDRARGIDKIWDLVHFVRFISESQTGLWTDIDLLYLREWQKLNERKATPPAP